MKRSLLVLLLSAFAFTLKSQSVKEKIESETKKLVADSQMRYGILGLYVADANTGELVYEWNSKLGLAPASTQKIITSVAAFDLLGTDYRYKTEFGYTGQLHDGKLNGDLHIKGYGDPTLGSRRFDSTKPGVVFGKLIENLNRLQLKKITGNIYLDASAFGYQPLPGGWIWDDIGNYYGAGSWGINWRENQYDLLLKPGVEAGDDVEILGTEPKLISSNFMNNLKTGKRGSGDNAYIYYPPYSSSPFVEGTYEGGTKISGSFPNAPLQFAFEAEELLHACKIHFNGFVEVLNISADKQPDILFAHHSPTMDSIIYWFMQKSINLYGEALVKTIGYEKGGAGTTDTGVAIVRRYLNEQGIVSPAEIRIIDGSGLSPSNRVTAESLGKILVYARKQRWYPAFAASFPKFNNMNLKSGTIRGAKSFAGYHTGKDGREYVVAIIVNNYDGTASAVVSKMYKVLDTLK